MDEIAKTEARNYVSMAGFILIAIFSLFTIFGELDNSSIKASCLILGILILVLGIFLAILGNRGLTTIFFIAHSMMLLIGYLISGASIIVSYALIVLAILMLFGKNGKKFIYFLVSLLAGLLGLFAVQVSMFSSYDFSAIILGLGIAIVVILAWCAIACATERIAFPGRNLICEDEDIDFKTSGSVVGYLLFAMVCAVWVAYYLLSENIVSIDGVNAVKLVCGAFLLLLAVLLFAIAKMRFTPMVFLLVGAVFILSTMVTGTAMYAFGVVLILLGIISFLRHESRVFLALFLIIYGLTYFISVLITGNYNLGIFHVIINLIPCLVALYLGFAVFTQKKNLLI
ncbi:MAG TPA: hypothetical protein O0X50_00050 [Methanocorpusculum sp.]|nr:hypothetical protein [Methanocorpusculum sp.]